MLVNKKHLRTAKRANNLEEAGKTLHEDELEGEKDVKESKSQNEYDIKSSDDGDGTTNIWTLIADDGPLKDAHVNVLWSAYFDDTIEKFTEHFQVQMWAWENTPGGDYDMWVSRLEAMKKSAKVPITNIVALGLGSLHESNPDACCGDIPRFIEGERTFISSGPSVQLAIVMKMREVLGGMWEKRVQDSNYHLLMFWKIMESCFPVLFKTPYTRSSTSDFFDLSISLLSMTLTLSN